MRRIRSRRRRRRRRKKKKKNKKKKKKKKKKKNKKKKKKKVKKNGEFGYKPLTLHSLQPFVPQSPILNISTVSSKRQLEFRAPTQAGNSSASEPDASLLTSSCRLSSTRFAQTCKHSSEVIRQNRQPSSCFVLCLHKRLGSACAQPYLGPGPRDRITPSPSPSNYFISLSGLKPVLTKITPRLPKMAPRWPKTAPRWTQDSPRWPQDARQPKMTSRWR